MNTTTQIRTLIKHFIEAIWNNENFDRIDEFLHPDFTDRSLPPSFSPDKNGLVQWVKATGKAFKHYTKIEEQATENDTCIIKIEMDLMHIGTWRNIAPTNKTLSITGYRCFRVKDQKIITHHALIDGNAIENQLKETAHGCKAQE